LREDDIPCLPAGRSEFPPEEDHPLDDNSLRVRDSLSRRPPRPGRGFLEIVIENLRFYISISLEIVMKQPEFDKLKSFFSKKILKSKPSFVFYFFIAFLSTITLSFLLAEKLYNNRIYQGVMLAGKSVGGYDTEKLKTYLTEKQNLTQSIKIRIDDQEYDLSLNDINFSYNSESTYNLLLTSGKNRYRFALISLLNNLIGQVNENPVFVYDEQKLLSNIDYLSVHTASDSLYPSITYENNNVVFQNGTNGKSLNKSALKEEIDKHFNEFDFGYIYINTDIVNSTLSNEEADNFVKRVKYIAEKTFAIKIAEEDIEIDKNILLSFFDPWNKYNNDKVNEYIQELSNKYNSPAKEPIFKFENGKVVEFTPATVGLELNKTKLHEDILNILENAEGSEQKDLLITADYRSIQPRTKTEEVNTYGIKELVGVGRSNYSGSITSRIHNLTLAASKFNGVLVTPGEIFSFNKTLGDVSKVTGYQQAYIIQEGQTVLGDGGGVCQVSTTLFRALLNAGFPIVERRAHSYRVGYYENDSPPGLDATVFDPTTDLKFKNDTENYLLIQTYVDKTKKSLTFELYGTKDGRIAITTKPVTTSSTPPPEDLYIDDPTLPSGTIKQIDYKAWGAKVVFNYKVERDGSVIFEKTFYSNYLPWQAKFLRGTGV